LNYIGSPQTVFVVRIVGIGISAKNNALITPIGKVANGRGVANIVVQTKIVSAKLVVSAVDINSIAKNMRLSVGDVFVGWKVGIKRLFFHTFISFC
jgi:hypothetical protein